MMTRNPWARLDLVVALVALLVAVGTAIFVGLETQCQRHLNQAAADESAATAALIEAIFVADQLDEQLAAYTAYLAAMRAINQRRANERCAPSIVEGIS